MPTTADSNANAPAAEGRFGKRGGEPQEHDEYRVVVRWIPLVVPLFALLIAILVALIEWGVL